MKFLLSLFLSTAFCSSAVLAQSHEIMKGPLEYKVNRARSRTSAIIRGGNFNGVISDCITSKQKENINCDFNYDYFIDIAFSDDLLGKDILSLPDSFFNGITLEEIVQNKDQVIETDFFKAKYLESKNITFETESGSILFENAIRVELTELHFKNSKKQPLENLIRIIAKATDPKLEAKEIENLVVRAWLHPSVPIIGALLVDISGETSGINFKIGFDLLSFKE